MSDTLLCPCSGESCLRTGCSDAHDCLLLDQRATVLVASPRASGGLIVLPYPLGELWPENRRERP